MTNQAYNKFIHRVLGIMVVLMPFYGLIISLGRYYIIDSSGLNIVKDIVLFLLLVLALVVNYQRIKFDLKSIKNSYLSQIVLLTAGYILIGLVISYINHLDFKTIAYGLRYSLLPVGVFLIARLSDYRLNLKMIIYPGALVGLLAICQFLTPESWLKLLGYGNLIGINQPIGPGLDFYRAFSSLGGPNQLAAYLILPISILLYSGKKHFGNNIYYLILSTMIIGLMLSFSRSGMIAMVLIVLVRFSSSWNMKSWLRLGVCMVLVTIGLGILLIYSDTGVESWLLHGKFDGRLVGSDSVRINHLKESIQAITDKPLGYGLGTAGASAYQLKSGFVPENSFLQEMIQVGILGAILIFWVYFRIFEYAYHQRGRIIIGLALGYLVINSLLHGFSDASLAVVLFAYLGSKVKISD